MAMTAILKTLDELSYVIECAALDFLGEGRTELGKLCENLESNPAYAFEGSAEILAGLREALALYRKDNKVDGSTRLTQVSRALWRIVNGNG
jgi:hypothetical protein